MILHFATVVAPLPLLLLPIIHAADPFVAHDLIFVFQILSQSTVSELQRLRELAVSVFALKVCIEPAFFARRQEVAIVADLGEIRRAKCIHSTGSR